MAEETQGRKDDHYNSYAHRFMSRTGQLARTTPSMFFWLHASLKSRVASFESLLEDCFEPDESKPGSKRLIPHRANLIEMGNRRINDISEAMDQIPRMTLVAMFSELDVLMGSLAGQLLRDNPKQLEASERKYTLREVIEAGGVEALRDRAIEKDVESLLRSSLSDQFDWFAGKLNVPLRTGLRSWPVLIEASQRRNLFVHTDGVVGAQYLRVCKDHDVSLPVEIRSGTRLRVDPEYLFQVTNVLLEVGTKLSQVVWRKMRPDELKKAELYLINASYRMILDNFYDAAANTLDFFVNELKQPWAEPANRYLCVINLAQAQRWSGDTASAARTLQQIEYGVLDSRFCLAKAALSGEFALAAKYMRQGGHNGPYTKEQYRDWPVFRELRKTPEFANTYLQVFGHSFESVIEELREIAQRAKDAASRELGGARNETNVADDDVAGPSEEEVTSRSAVIADGDTPKLASAQRAYTPSRPKKRSGKSSKADSSPKRSKRAKASTGPAAAIEVNKLSAQAVVPSRRRR